METVNNVVNAASKAIWGEPTAGSQATTTDATVPRTLPNETAGEEPVSGFTGNTEAGEPYDRGNEVPSATSQQHHTSTTETDPLGHTNKEGEIGGPSSTAHSNVKEPGFTQTTERSEETGARQDIKGSVAEERSNIVGTGPVSTSDGPVERVGEGIDARSDKPEESGNPPAATSKSKDTNDETTDVAQGQSHNTNQDEPKGKGADKISILKTGQHPYGESNVPDVIAKDLKEGEHPSEKLTGHPEGQGEKYATFTDAEAASTAKGEDVEKALKSGKHEGGASKVTSGTSEDGETKEKLSLKDKLKAKIHRH